MQKHLHPLRSLVLSCLLVLGSCFYSKAQWVSIPDINFGTWLDTSGYSQCMQGNNTVGWQMDTTCSLVVTAGWLGCNGKNIQDLTGVQYFDNLFTLDCYDNQLTTLPALPPALITLNCYANQLTTLSPLPLSLKVLACFQNQLVSLPSLPGSLLYLECSMNQLNILSALPAALTTLNCDQNQLTTLPSLPAALSSLRCSANQLSSLPALPQSLTDLACENNLLTTLPVLPASLININCGTNQLTTLPVLPTGLIYLTCYSNQLNTLPALPDSLRSLSCHSNLLNSLPELPDTLYNFQCFNNPNLHCFPKLKVIRSFYFYDTGVNCLPNYPEGIMFGLPPVNTMPLCEGINENSCPVYWNISGNQYSDANNNCLKDTAEYFINNVSVQLHNNGVLEKEMLTVYGGYSFVTETYGTYTVSVDTANLPFMVSCPASNLYSETITTADTLHGGRNFGITCKPGFDIAAWSITGGFVPANIRSVYISAGDASNFYNAHCATGVSGSVVITYTGPVQFVSAANGALTPTATGNTLTYTIADFGNVNFFTDFNIVMHTDTTAQIGQQVCFTLTVNPIAGDNNPANNVLTHCFTVVASYDPNDKTAYPAGNIDTAQKELTYTIRFQNTGTAEAQHIYITDTLDTDADASSFQLLAYSHQPMVQLKENAVRFNFPNINLPDSNTNEPASHGYVQYKVKLKPNLPIGTVINNTAYIYFDFNAPVVTNTTTNTISLNTGIQAVSLEPLAFRMFPNPSNSNVTISVAESLVGSTAIVSDVMGRVVFKSEITNPKSEINVAGFGAGVYFVTLGGGTQKLIIHR